MPHLVNTMRAQLLATAIAEMPPLKLSDGGVLADGFDESWTSCAACPPRRPVPGGPGTARTRK